MKSTFIVLTFFILLITCKSGNDSTALDSTDLITDSISLKSVSDIFTVDTLTYRNLLQGMWAKDESSNLTFEIRGDSLFNFEDSIPVYYNVKQDSFRVFIDGNKYSSKILKLTRDSLIREEYNEIIKLYRRN